MMTKKFPICRTSTTTRTSSFANLGLVGNSTTLILPSTRSLPFARTFRVAGERARVHGIENRLLRLSLDDDFVAVVYSSRLSPERVRDRCDASAMKFTSKDAITGVTSMVTQYDSVALSTESRQSPLDSVLNIGATQESLLLHLVLPFSVQP
jgi:hypothetical protein